MNKNINMVHKYHNQTKHSLQKYANSLGFMDWDTKPDPYRTYLGAKQTILPLSFENSTLPYHLIFDENKKEIAPFCIESISQFFQFSMGLSAIKSANEQSWELRCNASSGNLQPSEAYIICQDIENIDDGFYHYAPKNHALELLCDTNSKLNIDENSFLVALSSIKHREAWKYGERAWRYTQLDCGHAFRALEVSALILGWKIEKIDTNEDELSDLLGFNQQKRYIKDENETPDILFRVSKNNISLDDAFDIKKLRNCFDKEYQGTANQLSISWHKWEILDEIEIATKKELPNKYAKNSIKNDNDFRKESFESKKVILSRRSAQMMNKNDNSISFNQFETLIASVACVANSAINLIFFVNNIEDLDAGIYILIRDSEYEIELFKKFKNDFLWSKIDTKSGMLYLLKKGNYSMFSKTVSCNQDIAKDGAFSVGMLASFESEIEKNGAFRYKELYWECGSIGQQLYLEATSLGLSATGIGCYLDDMFHHSLGIDDTSFQSLYHFTIGRGIFDSRISSCTPYLSRKS